MSFLFAMSILEVKRPTYRLLKYVYKTWISNFQQLVYLKLGSMTDLYNTDGYNFVGTHRPVKKGGGVGIFIRNNALFQIRNDLNIHNEFCESTFIKIDKDIFDKKKIIIIAVIYRSPGSDMKLFNEIFYESLNKIKKENSLIYLMGDYNINLLNYGKHSETNEFVGMLHAGSFISLINRPTRVQKITPDSIKHFKA